MLVTDDIKSLFQLRPQADAIPIDVVLTEQLESWLDKLTVFQRRQLQAQNFRAESGELVVLVDINGHAAHVCVGAGKQEDFWSAGAWVRQLPAGVYCLNHVQQDFIFHYALAWGLGAYIFSRYKKSSKVSGAKLMLPCQLDYKALFTLIASIYWVRDLINTPAEDMMPQHLFTEAKTLAKQHKASCKAIVGDKLLGKNYPAVHAVGRGSHQSPHLIDLQWGNSNHPKLTLVGKGVCYDTGGLNLKLGTGMLTMKKDMGGAAHALALAHLVMSHKLPVRLRVLIPAVENAISDHAYRPGDVIQTRAGLSVEVGNTDAEGRLILADALTEAESEDPDLMIDFATLTGAQRIAFGGSLPAFFTGNDKIMTDLIRYASSSHDPAWPMPLFQPYDHYLDSHIADLSNISTKSAHGGAIVAALFLGRFVQDKTRWIHFDFSAWNEQALPGRPVGGEAMALRLMFAYLEGRYSS